MFPVVKEFDFHCFLFHRRHLDRSPGRASSASRRSSGHGDHGDRDRHRKSLRSEAIPEPAISSKEQADAEFLLSKITEEAERLKKQKQDMQEHHEKQLEALQKESERMAKELEVAEKNRIEAERVAKELEVAEKNRIEAENAEKAEQNQQVSCLIFQSFFPDFQFQNPDIFQLCFPDCLALYFQVRFLPLQFQNPHTCFKASKDMPPGSPESQEDPAEPRKEMEEDMIKRYKKQRKLEVQNLNLVKTQFELMEKAGRVGRKLCEDRLQEIEDNKEKEVGKQKHYFLIKKIFLWTTF